MTHQPLAILLPPSEGKAPGGDGAGWAPEDGRFGPLLADSRLRVARALKRARGGDERLLGVKGPSLERARFANRELVGAPCLPAWQRYTGVVWDHLEVGSLPTAARARASDAVVVVSGIAGLVGLDDPLPDHRLKLSVRLGALGRIADFWRNPLSAALNDHLAGRLVIDLLPAEHAAAWTPEPDRYDLRRVRLVDPNGRVVGHAAKAAKGLLARALVSTVDPKRALRRFAHNTFTAEIR